jgi:CheY-like chemotaxis protein
MGYSSIKSILLVDDDQDDKYFFAKALETSGVDAFLTMAENGLDAFEKLESDIPDVILLDLNMPKMNGMTFLKTIKKTKHLKDIPVIIYSTSLTIFDEQEALKLGAYGAFLKPEEFNKTVKTVFDILQMNFVRMTA